MYRNPMAHGAYRNHPCICGSGKKMKKCHGKDYAVTLEGLQEIHRLGEEHNARAREFDQIIMEKAAGLEKKLSPEPEVVE